MKVTSSLILCAAMTASVTALAQSSATVTGVPVSAQIFTPITLALSNGGLVFGDVIASTTASGSVALNPQTEARTATTVTLATTHSANSAHFSVGGESGAAYAITLPASSTLSDGASHNMTVDTFQASVAAGAPGATTGTLTGGAQTFNVGATLHVSISQLAGTYTGTFDVSVAYN